MNKPFENKVVLVTGASQGLGRAIAVEFARAGAAVVLAARSASRLSEVEQEIRRLGARALVVPTDVTSEAAVDRLVNATMNAFGRVDVLVNNAGIGKVGEVFSEGFAEDVHETLQASLFGAILVTRRFLPVLRRQGSGTIVNMSSVMGRKAFARFGSYAIVMHAVSAYSDALRQELAGTGINVSVIHPALTATDLLRTADEADMPPPFRHMTPLTPEYVGQAVVRAVLKGQRRVVLPKVANMLLLAEAFNPFLGDLVARGLTVPAIAALLGFNRGRTYHQSIGAVNHRLPSVG